MWPDNETARDFLNFSGVADTVAEIIVQAEGRPVSIGVSGAWGVGKSSMIKLIRGALERRNGPFVFVEFNAWLYQGYDDARASLLEVIATALAAEGNTRKTGVEKAQELLSRVNWLRVAKITAGGAIPLAFGMLPVGLGADLYQLVRKAIAGRVDEEAVAAGEETAQKLGDERARLFRPKLDASPPKELHAIRECFEQTLSELGVKLVVLIDDLDRCLPPTTISTLEAIRLFLFLKNAAFVIAADETMIKHAVRNHFEGVDDSTVINYFDKLIQVPIRVPPLGTQEVRAYLMMLFVDNSALAETAKEDIRTKVCGQLAQTWRGCRVDRAFMQTTYDHLPPDLVSRFDTAERLAPLMTTANQIAGNPRLIKRFLNALSIRMTISKMHGVGVDETVLAKVLLFERCAESTAYDVLRTRVNNDDEGKPRFLAEWEEKELAGEPLELDKPWDQPFIREWLAMPPRLSGVDLRGVLYVSREHAPLITPEDRLSSEAADLLAAILEQPEVAAAMHERLAAVPRPEMTIIMDRVLERARQIQEWGTPPILDAALAACHADPAQGQRLAAFLRECPTSQIKPSIVPKIGDQPWAGEVFDGWYVSGVAPPVKGAITQERKRHGNI